MIKYLVLCLGILALTASAQEDPKKPIVTTNSGQIQGKSVSCGLFCSYIKFLGIPYAEPPVKHLRFRNPVPHKGWEGVRDGSKHGSVCLSAGYIPIGGASGSEDCLFLNVYTPKKIEQKLAVMVYFHGGSFASGSGNSWVYGPGSLVSEGIVMVSVNYRLGLLGFFSTGDEYAQGNWGLKDIVEALRWIKNNIYAFGGDPENITIFGESAGGVIVHTLVLSKMAEGLFNRAISQSGSSLVPWALQLNPRKYADKVAEHFELPYESQKLVYYLRNEVEAEKFLEIQDGWLSIPVPRGCTPFDFTVTVEPENSPQPRFLTKTPFEIMSAGDFNQVPYLIGNNNMESMFMIRELLVDPDVFKIFNEHPEYLVPLAWNVNPDSEESQNISTAMKNYYFDGQDLSNKTKVEWITYLTDHQFIYAIDKTVQLHSKKSKEPVYFYQFSYDGSFNILKRLLLLTAYQGAMHGDDVFYLFDVTNSPAYPILPNDHARTVKKRMIKLWTNFAKYSNPTPQKDDTLLQNVQWKPVIGAQEFLDIGKDLVFKKCANCERMELWNSLEQRYGSNIFT